ncbi:polysaccharide biosynthesis protein [Gottfriedia luciferensis]|uniref:Polysaccharide biosynthesis protein n=1 Tax=Gottfriedia luciferensis TaxID=178774 RepID=A0ABX2ZTW7_9BACI|nr:PssD/Cps14F family polysaccharide biosynthesis glycosyltransferase [Gottfriedia luciferensis]ODG93165.1 polysaccharide biosynthesis protein [Gottfriedia luciferensis]
MRVCFAASSGGHLEQLMMLYPLMIENDSFIFTEKTTFNYYYKGIECHEVFQINRREKLFIIKLIMLIFITFFVLIKRKPDVIISTGALVTLPLCLVGKIFGKKIVFIESFSKVNSPTLTGRIVYKFADLFIVQWEDMKKVYPKAKYGGGIY